MNIMIIIIMILWDFRKRKQNNSKLKEEWQSIFLAVECNQLSRYRLAILILDEPGLSFNSSMQIGPLANE